MRLNEQISDLPEGPVLVTFLAPEEGPQLTREELAELRGKLAAWEEDWSAPGMELYDKS